MRISTAYQYDVYQADIRLAQERVSVASRQLSTGKRINAPGDDPVGVARTITMRSLRAGMDQYQNNLNRAKGSLGTIDTTVGEMSTLVQEAYSLAVQGANGATDQTGRNAMAAQIASIQSRLIDLANSKGPNAEYMFAGQKTSTKPYVLSGTSLVFNGDSKPIHVEAGPGQIIQSNLPGEPLIGDLYKRLESLKDDLIGGQVGAISGVDIANMQSSLDALSSVRGQVGARMQTVDELQAQWQRRSDDLTTSISDVEEVDMSEAVLKYQQANQAYTAALTVAGQGFRLSLMDFIK